MKISDFSHFSQQQEITNAEAGPVKINYRIKQNVSFAIAENTE
jgi:hypothetical protein